jgi:site-specific recombinase XerD
VLADEDWVMPPIIAREGPKASARVIDFFSGQLRNRNTRAAYVHAISEFLRCAQNRGFALGRIPPGFVGAYLDSLSCSVPTQKQHLAALRVFFDWLVTGHVVESNPAASVRGPKLVVRQGKTPILPEAELRLLFDSIPAVSLLDLRDRALLGTFVYTFARVQL